MTPPAPPLWKLASLTHLTVKEQHAREPYQVAVLPLGATEPHNHHLPYGTDVFEAEEVADRACAAAWEAGARVLRLPALPFGVQSNLMEVPGAFPLNLYPSTMFAVLKDLTDSLEKRGIRKLVLLNSHGGNDCLKPFIREMMGRSAVFIALVDWWRVGSDLYGQIFTNKDDHAGELETSVMLAFPPPVAALVDLPRATAGAVRPTQFEAVNKGWASISRPWHLLTESTGVGDPREASKEKGERYLGVVVPRIATFLTELSQADAGHPAFPFGPK